MPEHGAVRSRRLETHQLWPPGPVRFEAPNGEGVCEIPATLTLRDALRYCAGCEDWRRIRGELAFIQADFVGCEECGTPWTTNNKPS